MPQRRCRTIGRHANGVHVQMGKEGVDIQATSRAGLVAWARAQVGDSEYIMAALLLLHHFANGGTVGTLEQLEGKAVVIDPASTQIVTVTNG